jgi:hypothetical protein
MKKVTRAAQIERLNARVVELLREVSGPKSVWVYAEGIVKVFATEAAALAWFEKYDPEGVAFRHDVIS